MNAKSASNTLTAVPDPAAVGSVTAALLKQVPTRLADQLRDAIAADLKFMFTTGMDAGRSNTWNAIDKAWPELGLNEPEPAAPSRTHLTLVTGGAR